MKLGTNSIRRRCALAASILITLTASICAQSNSQEETFSPELIRQLDAIKNAALRDDYAYQQLVHLTENIGPRPVGSKRAKAAVEYVAAQMRDLGLDVHLEEVKVRHWVRGAETAELVEYPGQVSGTQQKIVLTTLGGSTSTGVHGISADVVVVDSFGQLKSLGHDNVAGKIVLFNQKFDKRKADAGMGVTAYREGVGYREGGPKAAAELGAVAAVVRSIGGGEYRLPHTGDNEGAGIPAAAVAAEDADLIAHLSAEGRVRMHLTLTPQKLPDETSYNVIADLKGSEHSEQIVIVSGHLDSWDLGTGALDDGAGVVIAMEAAQVLQQLHLRPKRTLRFIAWMDEETDGAGSTQYGKDNHDDFPHYIAAIESDIGTAHPLGFATKMSQAAVNALKPMQMVLRSVGANAIEQELHPAGMTDLGPMSEEGVPVLSLMQDARVYYSYHHTAADTLDKVNASELRENAAAMAVMAYALADMKNPLPR